MTGDDILSEMVKRNFREGFRIAAHLKSFKGKKILSDHSLWFVVQPKEDMTAIFVDFEEPPDSKGLRFLFLLRQEHPPEAYMYLPATGKTLPLAMDDASADIGGTGLTMDDIRVFAPQANEKGTLLREERIEGRDCYLIRVELRDGKGERLYWISKDHLNMMKVQHLGPGGKIKRVFRVLEFFQTQKGREFPREEEIAIPDKGIRIKVRQENAVFGIEVPEELTDPKMFGKFPWKS
jgi:hypothetical protein